MSAAPAIPSPNSTGQSVDPPPPPKTLRVRLWRRLTFQTNTLYNLLVTCSAERRKEEDYDEEVEEDLQDEVRGSIKSQGHKMLFSAGRGWTAFGQSSLSVCLK